MVTKSADKPITLQVSGFQLEDIAEALSLSIASALRAERNSKEDAVREAFAARVRRLTALRDRVLSSELPL